MNLNPFTPTPVEKVADAQLYEAKRLLLEHQAAAEYHAAMATMLAARIARLEKS